MKLTSHSKPRAAYLYIGITSLPNLDGKKL